MARKPGLNNFGTLVRASMSDNNAPPDEDEINAEDGVLFYVNKSGFPIKTSTWERMWNHVAKIHPESYSNVSKIREERTLPEVPVPQAPLSFPPNMPTVDRLELVQSYMTSLEYNHSGTQFFEIKKNRPISGLMDSAKEMIRESLPIKCLEAVILGLYLTNGIMGLDRFTISFKTTFSGNTFRHVVLGVYYNGRYGALGMSRREDLMYKPLRYRHLSDIVLDFKEAYSKYWHSVKKIKLGLPIPHDSHSYESINWKHLSLSIPKMSSEEIVKETDKFAKEMKNQTKKWESKASIYLSHQKPKNGLNSSESWSPGGPKKQAAKAAAQSSQPHDHKINKKLSKLEHSSKEVGQSSNHSAMKNTETSFNYQVRI